MCLSTAYKVSDGVEYKIGDYISNLLVDGGEITLTDIMGSITKVIGQLKSVDLEKNVIIIESDA
ncbi:MAG: CooT family nickel-binding protein [Oscillospiraceae bacterium]